MTKLYIPDVTELKREETVFFQGKSSTSGEATIKQMSGTVNVRVFLERSNDGGETWETVSQFSSGNLHGSWFTEDIQPIVKENVRRLRVDNVGKNDGKIEVIGEER